MTTEEMKNKFIKKGWAPNIAFREIEENGKQLFEMLPSGNIYKPDGSIYRYNLKAAAPTRIN